MMYSGKIFDAKSSKAKGIEFWVEDDFLHFNDQSKPINLHDLSLLTSEYALILIFNLGDNRELHTQNKEFLEHIKPLQHRLNAIGYWMENHKISILGVSILSICLVVMIFLYGIPNASKMTMHILPSKVEKLLEEQTITFLESAFLEPTKISLEQQAKIKAKIDVLCKKQPCQAFSLYFYNAPKLGANAFATIGTSVIVTDDIVKISTVDEITSVVAHELGHIHYRHSYELFLNSIGLTTFFSILLGDISSFSNFATNLPIVLMQNGYSREMEEQADDYTLALLKSNQINPDVFKSILQKLDQRNTNHQDNVIDTFFSTHPSTQSRIEKFSN